MTAALIALDEPRASALADELRADGVRIVGVCPPDRIDADRLAGADAVVLPATRVAVTRETVAACDRAGVRIIALGSGESRLRARYGLPESLPADAESWRIAEAIAQEAPRTSASPPSPRRIIAVWGPQGAPGRSTVAIQLAVELSRTGRRCALVDADSVAPSTALLLGLSDDSPGVAAACRRADLGGLDTDELGRLSDRVETSGGAIDVLAGLNRPSRWPELSADRLTAALRVCREWAEDTVVDVAAAFDADDDITLDDPSGPRRHAATAAVLREADVIVAVTASDPLSISRFLRDHAELRGLVGPTVRILVVANRVRPGPLGIDPRGQLRRALERFAGITDVVFLPHDQRAADAALLHARPMADVTPRSALVSAVRRLADSLRPAPMRGAEVTAGSSRGSSPAFRRLLRAPAARAASRRGSDPGWAS